MIIAYDKYGRRLLGLFKNQKDISLAFNLNYESLTNIKWIDGIKEKEGLVLESIEFGKHKTLLAIKVPDTFVENSKDVEKKIKPSDFKPTPKSTIKDELDEEGLDGLA